MKLLIVFSFISLLSFSQPNLEEDKLLWSDTIKLEWNDFKGGVPFGDIGYKKAAIASEVIAECIDYFGCVPVFVVKTYCNRNKSWTVDKSYENLRHEQGHFDISEIYARRIRKKIQLLNDMKECDIEKYSLAINNLLNELPMTQKTYDNEVYFSEENALEWFKKIESELNDLDEYKFVK